MDGSLCFHFISLLLRHLLERHLLLSIPQVGIALLDHDSSKGRTNLYLSNHSFLLCVCVLAKGRERMSERTNETCNKNEKIKKIIIN